MNKRFLLPLIAAATLAAGSMFATSAMAAGYGMGPGMMAGQGMMAGAPAATQTGPAASGPRYYGMGPGRMQGYGRYGMMNGYGGRSMRGGYGGYGGYGMGLGMAGGYGGYGMGLGMMGGYGGYGMGPGMMGGYAGYALGLSAEQRGKIAGIWNDSVSKAWPIMGQLREQNFRFAQLMNESTPDREAVNKVYSRISELRKQLLDQRLDARQKTLEVLTAEQRKKLQQGFYHRWQ